MLRLAPGDHHGLSITILDVWVGVAFVAGKVMNRRRAVQLLYEYARKALNLSGGTPIGAVR